MEVSQFFQKQRQTHCSGSGELCNLAGGMRSILGCICIMLRYTYHREHENFKKKARNNWLFWSKCPLSYICRLTIRFISK